MLERSQKVLGVGRDVKEVNKYSQYLLEKNRVIYVGPVDISLCHFHHPSWFNVFQNSIWHELYPYQEKKKDLIHV